MSSSAPKDPASGVSDPAPGVSANPASESQLWASLVGSLLRLSRIYHQRLDSRRMEQCEAALKSVETALREYGEPRGLGLRRLLSEARILGLREEEDPEIFQEAASWWACVRTSYRLSFILGPGGGDPEFALTMADLHRKLRRSVGCVYPEAAGEALLKAASSSASGPVARELPDDREAFFTWLRQHVPEAVPGHLPGLEQAS